MSTYICHPSLGNDNLSGIVLTTLLAKILLQKKLEKSYRFLFLPETIGPITYLSKNSKKIRNIIGALVITCVAGPGKFGFKERFIRKN